MTATIRISHVTVEDGDAVDVRVEVAPGSQSERMNYSDGFFRLVSDDPAIGSTGAPTRWTGRGAQFGLRGVATALGIAVLVFVVPWVAGRLLAPVGTTGVILWWILRLATLGVAVVYAWRRIRYRPDPRSAAPPGR